MEQMLTSGNLVMDRNNSVGLMAGMASIELVPKEAFMYETIWEMMLTSLTLGVRNNNRSMMVMVVLASVELMPKEVSMQEA